MGVERSVTRWYVLRQILLEEIGMLEAKIAQLSDTSSETQDTPGQDEVDIQSLHDELAKTQEKVRLLGPCPQPMMG